MPCIINILSLKPKHFSRPTIPPISLSQLRLELHAIFAPALSASFTSLPSKAPFRDTDGYASNSICSRLLRRSMTPSSKVPEKSVKKSFVTRNPLKMSLEGSTSTKTLRVLTAVASPSPSRSVIRQDLGGLLHPGPRRSSKDTIAARYRGGNLESRGSILFPKNLPWVGRMRKVCPE